MKVLLFMSLKLTLSVIIHTNKMREVVRLSEISRIKNEQPKPRCEISAAKVLLVYAECTRYDAYNMAYNIILSHHFLWLLLIQVLVYPIILLYVMRQKIYIHYFDFLIFLFQHVLVSHL